LVSLSEQNLIDCVFPGESGCDGGWMGDAFEYIESNNGINTEESYPYVGYYQDCKFKKKNVGAYVSGYVNVDATEAALQEAVATIGPISAAIDSSKTSFQHYYGGVYFEPNCSSSASDTNHGL
jgi:cathepsin L